MDTIYITQESQEQIIIQAQLALPYEACGFALGKFDTIEKLIPVTNSSTSIDRFEMNPEEQVHALLQIEMSDYDLIGIVHSHPKGPETPSLHDISEFHFCDRLIIICACCENDWKIKGYRIVAGEYHPVEIVGSGKA